MNHKLLIKLYAEIPKVNGCKSGCNDCCGIVPLSPEEQASIGVDRPFTSTAESIAAGCLGCPFSTTSGCSTYDKRPFMCRLFAAVDDPRLKCPHGAKAEKPLSAKRAEILRDRYAKLMNKKQVDKLMKQIVPPKSIFDPTSNS